MKQFLIYLMLLVNTAIVSAQSVGIGTTTPSSSAILDLSSTSKGLLVPRMTTIQRNLIPAVGGLMVFDTDFKEYYQNDGSVWRKLLNSTFWNSSTTRSWVYNTTDSIGLGTTTPDEKLHINSGSIYLQDNRANKNPHVIFDIPAVDNNEAGLQFKRSGDTLASMNYVEDVGIANYIRLGVGASGLRNDLTINTNGEIGVGSLYPKGKMHISGYNGDNLVIDDSEGIIQFTQPAIGGSIKRGFLQLANIDDLRLGTNSGSSSGKVILRTNGNDQVVVDSEGEVGIGTIFPLAKLHIPTGEDADLSSAANGYVMLGAGTTTSLLLDNNEIMVRSNYTTPGTLSIQNDGGEVAVGARTTINKSGQALVLNGTNSNISLYQTGSACNSFLAQSSSELFIGVNSGKLHLDGTQVAIGGVVAGASAYKLSVTGKIICEELKVKLVSSGWPDYVFANDYKLKSLSEVEQFILKNKHLPNIPSASEVEKNGIEVGDMQKRMMEKIEELTLYIIDLQKQIDSMKEK